MKKQTQIALCPCDTGNTYTKCCKPYHEQELLAPDPLSLMRSRYSAYALNKLDYLLMTWHPSTRPSSIEPNPESFKWIRLSIKKVHHEQHQVHFIAHYKFQGKAYKMEELSQFTREEGRWYYVDGEISET